jgi:hypothetical protein
VVPRVFVFPVRLFEPIPEFDMVELPREDELPIVVDEPLIEFEYEFVFDIELLDIVDELPYEFVPPIELLLLIVFIELALFAPLELYVLVMLLDDPPQAAKTTLSAMKIPKANIFFISFRPPQRWLVSN